MPSFKVELTKEEKRQIGRSSSPRWEVDLVAYKGSRNEILAVECKSFLDSAGVTFRNGRFEPEKRYKLFADSRLRTTVLNRLKKQLVESGACAPEPSAILCLATGKIACKSDLEGLKRHFESNRWKLFDTEWIRGQLLNASGCSYENEIAFVVSKILLRAKGKGTGK